MEPSEGGGWERELTLIDGGTHPVVVLACQAHLSYLKRREVADTKTNELARLVQFVEGLEGLNEGRGAVLFNRPRQSKSALPIHLSHTTDQDTALQEGFNTGEVTYRSVQVQQIHTVGP